jgi:hypothetical protein
VAGKPKAVHWYKVYCYCFSALNFYTAWHGYQLVRDPLSVVYGYKVLRENAVDQATTDILATSVRTVGWSLLAMGLVFGITAFSLPLAPDNRKTWTAHLVHILFGATSCVLAPLCVPLFFAWLKPEVKEYFGVGKGRA